MVARGLVLRANLCLELLEIAQISTDAFSLCEPIIPVVFV